MEAIVRTAAGMFEAAACSIALTDPSNGELVYEAAWGAGASEVVGMRLPPGVGIAGAVVASGDGVFVPECRKDPRFARQVAAGTGYVPYTMVVAPLVREGKTIGCLSVLDRRDGGPYLREDLGKVALFADLAVVALDLDTFPLSTRRRPHPPGLAARRSVRNATSSDRARVAPRRRGEEPAPPVRPGADGSLVPERRVGRAEVDYPSRAWHWLAETASARAQAHLVQPATPTARRLDASAVATRRARVRTATARSSARLDRRGDLLRRVQALALGGVDGDRDAAPARVVEQQVRAVAVRALGDAEVLDGREVGLLRVATPAA